MLPRTPRSHWIALLVATFAACAPHALGQVSAGATPAAHQENASQIAEEPDHSNLSNQSGGATRYHFGDDPDGKLGWADPNFDDSSWPVATQGRWPIPAFYSDGFMWVRVRIPVSGSITGPLALRDTQNFGESVNGFVAADEVFVNGVQVGGRGGLPPRTELKTYGHDSVFDLPPGLAVPGKTAVVAFRAWYPPDVRWPDNLGREI